MSQFTEGDASIGRLTAAVTAFEKVLTEPEGVMVDMPVGAAQPSLAQRLKFAIDAVTVKPAEAAAQAITASQQALASQQAAAQSALDAANSAVGYTAPPFPDVWAPLNDDLRLLAGFAPADIINVGGTNYPLPSKSVTLTRATTATYIDKSGVLRTAAINEPRFEKEGLLIEEQRTNLALYSMDLSNAYWNKTRVTMANGYDAPDGSKTACKVIADASTSAHYLNKLLSVNANKQYAFSVFVKAAEFAEIRLSLSSGGTVGTTSYTFTLDTGKVTAAGTGGTGGVPTITRLANDWWRVSIISEVMATTGTAYFNIWISENGSTSPIQGDDIKGLYLWGVQVEEATGMSSFIPTTTATVTRAADDCTLQRSGNDNWWGPITISLEMHCNGATPSDGASANRRGVFAFYPSSTEYADMMLDSSASQAGRLAFTYGARSYNFYGVRVDDGKIHRVASVTDTLSNKSIIDGGNPSPPTTASRPAPGTVNSANTLMYLGRGADGATASGQRMLNGHIRNLRIWHRALSDFQIKGLR